MMDAAPRRYRILVLTPQRPRWGAASRAWSLMAQLARRHDLPTLGGPGESRRPVGKGL